MNEIRSDGKPGLPCGPMVQPAPLARRKAVKAVRLWAGLTLSSVLVLTTLAIWHLVRRGRLIQQGLGNARNPKPLGLPGDSERLDP